MFLGIGILAAGAVPGRLLRRRETARKVIGRATMLVIYCLLFSMGARLGGNDSLFDALGLLGAQALLLGFLSTMGSVACMCLCQRFFRPGAQRMPQVSDSLPGSSKLEPLKGMSGSGIILLCFLAGLALSRMGMLHAWLYTGNLCTYLLWGMLFCVGMTVGFDLGALRIVREMGLRVLLVPFLTIAGSLAGALVAFPFLDNEIISLGSCLAAGSSVAYYSLSSVVLTQISGPVAGSIALIANIFRELFTVVAAPLLVRLFGALAPVAAGGAAAMDTCLPVIARLTGERCAIIAIFNGLAMTIAVPFMIPLLLAIF